LSRREWQRKRRVVRRTEDSEIRMDMNEAARRAEAFAKDEWNSAAVTDKYEDAEYYVIKGVSPSGEWTVMFDKRTGKRVVPP
jgi:hypothetical protein